MTGSKQGDLFGLPAPAPVKREDARVVKAAKPVVPPSPPPPPSPKEAPTPAWRKPAPAPASAPRVLSVSELTAQVKDTLEPAFSRVLVRGEVSNFRGANASGHFYFALKDPRASIDVKLWASTARRFRFALKEGMALIIEGSVDVYEPSGRYSLIVNRMEPEGVGARALAFEQLKEKFKKEGLIGEHRTRPPRHLPRLPRAIGVVTSVSGAALQDFLKTLHRRHPRLPVLVADARVQGEGASFELRRALKWLSAADVDVIVVTRGGGSADDLWTFNDEALARAVWACPVPVVSAVGHEIDTTLCDLVADLRAPTPTAAAELVSPVLAELESQVATLQLRLEKAIEKVLLHERSELRHLKGELGDPRRVFTSRRIALSDLRERLQKLQPQAQLRARRATVTELHAALRRELERGVRERRQTLASLRVRLERQNPRLTVQRERSQLAAWSKRLDVAMRRRVAGHRELQQKLYAKLEALSPLAVLSRGYALARRDDGHVLRAPTDVSAGEDFTLRLQHGELRVQAVKKKE